MFIRRKPNKSGTFSVQVVSKRDGSYILEKSFSASSDEATLKNLEMQASDWIAHHKGQGVIDFTEHKMQEDSRLIAEGVLDNIDRVLLNGPLHVLNTIYDTIGFNRIKD